MLRMYDFVCRDCGSSFEKLTETPHNVECPSCESTACTLLMSAAAIKAKGVGIYDTKMRV